MISPSVMIKHASHPVRVSFSPRKKSAASADITGVMYRYIMAVTAPIFFTDRFHNVKLTAEAKSPKNIMFDRFTGFSSSAVST